MIIDPDSKIADIRAVGNAATQLARAQGAAKAISTTTSSVKAKQG